MSVVNLRDPDTKAAVLGPFTGLNAYDAPYTLAREELVSAVNVNLRERSVVSRLGQSSRIDILHTLLYKAVRKMHRYVSRRGLKKLYAYSGDTVYSDVDDSQFDPLVSIASDDGYVRFAQHRNAMMMFSRIEDTRVYDPGISSPSGPLVWPLSEIRPYPVGVHMVLLATGSDTGGGLPAEAIFSYRYTVDAYAGDNFLGELPMGYILDQALHHSGTWVDMSAFVGSDDNMVTFTIIGDGSLYNIPSWVKTINIYRSAPLGAVPGASGVVEEAAHYWVGSISADDYKAASSGDTLFEDKWDVPYGKAYRYGLSPFAPRARFATFHKGRLWLANVATVDALPSYESPLAYTIHDSRLYWSYFGENGIEPAVFTADGFQEIEAQDGEGITGMVSVRGAGLLVFKPGSTSIVRGADDDIVLGIPNIQVDLLDGSIGLIAPESLQHIEGAAIWLSHQGIAVFDGGRVRIAVSRNVLKILQEIPDNRLYYATSSYNPEEHEYTLFFSHPDASVAYNRMAVRYNFRTGGWTTDTLQSGVASTVTVQDGDAKAYVIWGGEDREGAFAAGRSIITTAEDSITDAILQVAGGTNHWIPGSFQTAFDPFDTLEHKQLQGFLIEADSGVPITIDILADNKYDSRDSGEGLVLSPPTDADDLVWGVGKWGQKNWAGPTTGGTFKAAVRPGTDILYPSARRFSFIVSWLNGYEPVKIHPIVVFYKRVNFRTEETE